MSVLKTQVFILQTAELGLTANPDIPAIFEGTFEHGCVLLRVDILHRRKDERWRLIEVKSTTDVRDHHIPDVAIQHRVVSRSGFDLASACLAHVNRDYIYQGGSIDAHRFFRIRNVTRRVLKLQPELPPMLRSQFRVLAMPEAPRIAVISEPMFSAQAAAMVADTPNTLMDKLAGIASKLKLGYADTDGE